MHVHAPRTRHQALRPVTPGVQGGPWERRAVRNILRSSCIQPKLRLGATNDPAEAEADRVADQVMRMPEPAARVPSPAVSASAGTGPVRRLCAECESELHGDSGEDRVMRREEEEEIHLKRSPETVQRLCPHCAAERDDAGEEPVRRQAEDEEDLVQTKEAPGGTTELSPASESLISGLGGGGVPLPASERAFFEPRFGRDFSGVRVDDGPAAADAAGSINARAFTLGTDIAFAKGEYRPRSNEGRRLIAHELAHTVQQSVCGGRLQRAPSTAAAGTTPSGSFAPGFDDPPPSVADLFVRAEQRVRRVRSRLLKNERRTMAAFAKTFKTSLPVHAASVGDTLDDIAQNLGRAKLRQTNPAADPVVVIAGDEVATCAGGALAFHRPAQGKNVVGLCFAFLKLGDKAVGGVTVSADLIRQGILMHEMAHVALAGETDIYRFERLFDLVGSERTPAPQPTPVALTNLDSLVAFILRSEGLSEAEARLGEMSPEDRFAVDSEEQQAKAFRALAFAEAAVNDATRAVALLDAALGGFQAGETWSGKRRGDRNTVLLLRHTRQQAAGFPNTLPPRLCRAADRFQLTCPSDSATPTAHDETIVHRLRTALETKVQGPLSDKVTVFTTATPAPPVRWFTASTPPGLQLTETFFAVASVRAQTEEILTALASAQSVAPDRPVDLATFATDQFERTTKGQFKSF